MYVTHCLCLSPVQTHLNLYFTKKFQLSPRLCHFCLRFAYHFFFPDVQLPWCFQQYLSNYLSIAYTFLFICEMCAKYLLPYKGINITLQVSATLSLSNVIFLSIRIFLILECIWNNDNRIKDQFDMKLQIYD